MADQQGLEEIVLLFDEDDASIDSEMLFSEFEALAGGSPEGEITSLDRIAASVVHAVYAHVGAGLTVRAMVFFQFTVDENGQVTKGFNLPLTYLLEQAGQGPDLGMGAVKMASRAQCPVPWHAANLWEPKGEGDENSAMLVQKAVWRNRLSLKASGTVQPMEAGIELIAYGDEAPTAEKIRKLENKLTESFGEDGKVGVKHLIHQQGEQLSKISEKYRTDLEAQQQAYLTQIRGHKDEIQKLKSLLRNEQERSRRLQAMLRGEV
ncbi:MAG: hypothetical protein O7F71_17320 [Gammaproteobacteria bacterium]|nr:hypothetical protein [Gammaproteobacteria bacterium]